MAQTQLNNYSFHYQEKGKGDCLVFVHGSASDYRTWENQIETFSDSYRCVSYSRRYHWPNKVIEKGQDYSMLQHVDDLESFLNFIGQIPVHLVGHSYGAFISLLLALRKPELIASLVLAEPPVLSLYVSDPPRPKELGRLFLTKPGLALAIIKFGLKGIAPALKAFRKNDREAALKSLGKAILGNKAFFRLTPERKEQARKNLIEAEIEGSGFPPLDRDRIRHIEIPSLLISAKNSPKIFHFLIKELQELLPNKTRVIIPDASHIMHEDNPEYYNSALQTFIKLQEKSKNEA